MANGPRRDIRSVRSQKRQAQRKAFRILCGLRLRRMPRLDVLVFFARGKHEIRLSRAQGRV